MEEPVEPRTITLRLQNGSEMLYEYRTRVTKSFDPRFCCTHQWKVVKRIEENEELISLERCGRCLAQASISLGPVCKPKGRTVLEYDKTGELFERYRLSKIPVA
ncbi:MAG: hypothetical protein ACYDHY_06535 [Acidiferrobacterales bacterium]